MCDLIIYECEFCKNTFSSKYNLKSHQAKTKYCLKLQTKQPVATVTYTCKYCDKSFNLKHGLNYHLNICKKKGSCEKNMSEKDTYIRELELKLENERQQKSCVKKSATL